MNKGNVKNFLNVLFWIFLFALSGFIIFVSATASDNERINIGRERKKAEDYLSSIGQFPKREVDKFCEDVIEKDTEIINNRLYAENDGRMLIGIEKSALLGMSEEMFYRYYHSGKSSGYRYRTEYTKEPVCRLELEQALAEKGYLYYFETGTYYFFRHTPDSRFDGQEISSY